MGTASARDSRQVQGVGRVFWAQAGLTLEVYVLNVIEVEFYS